jgi:50S ribosome-binding GTPase
MPLTLGGQYDENQSKDAAPQAYPVAACDRLITVIERALRLEPAHAGVRDDTILAPMTQYIAAQLRMRIRPALTPGWPVHDPVHVALLGGTNSGKSTVLNLLVGRAAAGMHATARFTQHPAAYLPNTLGDRWLTNAPSRFLDYHGYRDKHPPRQSDDDLARHGYRPAFALFELDRLDTPVLAPPAAAAVFWDAPDFSTEAAQTYLSAVLDAVALADVVIMTVTDESYADDRATALLRMIQDSGVMLHVVANKLPGSPELLRDIEDKLTAHRHGTVLSLPLVKGRTPEERLGHLMATAEAETLRQTIAREAVPGPQLKRQALAGAVDFLQRRLGEVLRPLAAEVEMANAWERLVERITRQELLARYRHEYLDGERYGEFNQTLVRLMDQLEIPGVGPLLRLLSAAVRIPFRLASAALRTLAGRGKAPPTQSPEHEVLSRLIQHWLSALRSEAQLLASSGPHPAWGDLVRRLDSPDFPRQLAHTFERAYRAYRQTVDEEIQRRAQEIYHAVAQRPWLLNVLRGANLMVDATSITLVIKSGGLSWSDAVLGPLIAGLRHALLEAGLDTYLQTQQGLLKRQQLAALQTAVERHLAQPVRALLMGAVRAEELEDARRDLARLSQAALRVARRE